ncbi:hypothetical protein FB45DRAFT_758125 [Roridomyces roridus]|uniref:F-box domain-containing protein n=1 Tax=Roridomyces roridus TaxID=1738132 RepID=A0AAD7B9X1_9AGAR|nr:hypothetical protein FB45DRAFT_758125 [Roridomyces roridus]
MPTLSTTSAAGAPTSFPSSISSPIPSSVLTLAPEITAEIFQWCFDAYPSFGYNSTPLLLICVCRYWRDVALSTPALWDTIWFLRDPIIQTHYPALESWLKRSGTRPITLGIHYVAYESSAHLDMLIHNHASRLQYLQYTTSKGALRTPDPVPLLPVLETLRIFIFCRADRNEGPIQIFKPYAAPALRHLALKSLSPSLL